MTHLAEIRPESLTQQELLWLDSCVKGDYDVTDLKELLRDIRDYDLVLWRIEDSSAQGLIGTRLVAQHGKLDLWIELMVGEGIIKDIQALRVAVRQLAKQAHADGLAWFSKRPGMTKVYSEVLGVKPSATVFREEI